MKNKDTIEYTDEWKDKTAGETYNIQLDYYARTDLNWNMYNGLQWIGVNAGELPKFVMNIYRTATEYIIASIMSKPVVAEYSADNIPKPVIPKGMEPTSEQAQQIAARKMIALLNKAAKLKWEKDKMNYKMRQGCLLDAACSGDMCAHVYWDTCAKTGQAEKGDFKTEIIDGASVFFGNPNTVETEEQPYILITGRDLVSKLRSEAKAHKDENKTTEDDRKRILGDNDTEYQIGEGDIELEGAGTASDKATYVIKYWRDEKSGRIFFNKSTKDCPIRKNVDTGLHRYPIVWNNWQKRKNCYHGIPIGNGLIDNQISINQGFAMVFYFLKMNAFGKYIIDAERIQNWSNKIGEVIRADGNVNDIVKQVEGGSFNTAFITVLDKAIAYTKEFVGANDAALGQINPERASGSAIMLTAKQAAIPHANIEANLHQFIEDLYLVWGDFYLSKYNNRTLYFMGDDGIEAGEYDAKLLKDVILSCEINVGQSTLWSEATELQNLMALKNMGSISDVEMYERLPQNTVADVQGLIAGAKLKEMLAAQAQAVVGQLSQAVQGQTQGGQTPSGQAPQAGQQNPSFVQRQPQPVQMPK